MTKANFEQSSSGPQSSSNPQTSSKDQASKKQSQNPPPKFEHPPELRAKFEQPPNIKQSSSKVRAPPGTPNSRIFQYFGKNSKKHQKRANVVFEPKRVVR
jgi:hypothetical protein